MAAYTLYEKQQKDIQKLFVTYGSKEDFITVLYTLLSLLIKKYKDAELFFCLELDKSYKLDVQLYHTTDEETQRITELLLPIIDVYSPYTYEKRYSILVDVFCLPFYLTTSRERISASKWLEDTLLTTQLSQDSVNIIMKEFQ